MEMRTGLFTHTAPADENAAMHFVPGGRVLEDEENKQRGLLLLASAFAWNQTANRWQACDDHCNASSSSRMWPYPRSSSNIVPCPIGSEILCADLARKHLGSSVVALRMGSFSARVLLLDETAKPWTDREQI
ncbi:unnamed protein product [Cercospora beticola]|nr:unnamed protein product [Cercospora beticola]